MEDGETKQKGMPMVDSATEGLKLWKSVKGFSWEIKVLNFDYKRLEKINKEMEKRFGEKNNGK